MLIGDRTLGATPRWVYVLAIDCQGKGSLLWPYQGAPAARFPMENQRLSEIPLPGDPFTVQDPPGTDTYLLLTTATQLSDPSALEFSGVVSRSAGDAGTGAPKDPLEDLLDNTSAGTRSAGRPTPTNWSVQSISTVSVRAPGSIP